MLPVLLKKDFRHITSVTGLLDELGWLPLFERRKHSRLTVFYKALTNLSAISLDHLSVSSRHTRASNEKKFMSLPVRTDVFKHSFFPRTITDWNSLQLAVRLLQSTQSFHGALLNSASSNRCWSSWHSGGNWCWWSSVPLLDISPKNRRRMMIRYVLNIKLCWVWLNVLPPLCLVNCFQDGEFWHKIKNINVFNVYTSIFT